MTFGERLQLLRKEKYISQEQFAEVMNVSRQAVSKWELNQSYPEIDKLIELSNYFGVTLDYLIKDERIDLDEISHITADDESGMKSSNGYSDIYKMIILTALAIALTSIRFFIIGNFGVGVVLTIVSCIFIVGFYITRNYKDKR